MRSLAGPAVAALAVLLVAPSAANAHVERDSIWPDPAPDERIDPPAGGGVPAYRSVSIRRDRAKLTIVCQGNVGHRRIERRGSTSLRRLRSSVRRARRARDISAAQARRIERRNRSYARRCRTDSLQKAVDGAGNGHKIVVLPGHYTEPESRRQPHNDPSCSQYLTTNEAGQSGAPSYEYHWHCPNDISLVAVMGREPTGDPPGKNVDAGMCVRCNLQIEGTGVEPEDVILDAGDPRLGLDRVPRANDPANENPYGSVKEVAMKVDRADGFVVRNMTFAKGEEHGLYIHEVDGYYADRIKGINNLDYGFLMFTADHGLMERCEASGNGDSGVYPGSAADSAPRLNQEIRFCKLHHNALGYSGTMGNATHVHNNEFYGNATGIATDSFYAGGHPGFPQDSARFENNKIYSNNLNVYKHSSDVRAKVPLPVGTGILIAGGNENMVRGNQFWDNRFRGVMLLTVPDIFADNLGVASTSHRNRFTDNVMGIVPAGFERPDFQDAPAMSPGQRMPNGVDFWWDEFPGASGNCWQDNGEVRTDPSNLPGCSSLSLGTGNVFKEITLINCVNWSQYDEDVPGCDWFRDRPAPDSPEAQREETERSASQREGYDGLRKACAAINAATGGRCITFDRP